MPGIVVGALVEVRVEAAENGDEEDGRGVDEKISAYDAHNKALSGKNGRKEEEEMAKK